jgi:hypothetical protein
MEDDYTFFCRNENANHHLGTSCFIYKGIAPAVTSVTFVTDRIPYVTRRGPWGDIIVLNVHAPTEDKSDNMKDTFYGEIERVLDEFPK